MLWQEHDNICIPKEISSFMDSSKKKQLKNKQNMADLLTTATAITLLLSFWDVKGLLQTQKSQNLKNYYYANKFSNSTIAIRFQSSSNLFSCVIYTLFIAFIPLFIACKKIPEKAVLKLI